MSGGAMWTVVDVGFSGRDPADRFYVKTDDAWEAIMRVAAEFQCGEMRSVTTLFTEPCPAMDNPAGWPALDVLAARKGDGS